jgi:phosphohistidine phosphatase
MNKVFILRHAKAGEHTTNDHDRPLTQVGKDQARLMGQWFKVHDTTFDAVLTSSALRTVETVENLGLSIGFTIVPRLYSAPARVIESVIQDSGIDSGTLLVVGHNPGVSELVAAAGHHDVMATCAVVELGCVDALSDFSAIHCDVISHYRPEV